MCWAGNTGRFGKNEVVKPWERVQRGIQKSEVRNTFSSPPNKLFCLWKISWLTLLDLRCMLQRFWKNQFISKLFIAGQKKPHLRYRQNCDTTIDWTPGEGKQEWSVVESEQQLHDTTPNICSCDCVSRSQWWWWHWCSSSGLHQRYPTVKEDRVLNLLGNLRDPVWISLANFPHGPQIWPRMFGSHTVPAHCDRNQLSSANWSC